MSTKPPAEDGHAEAVHALLRSHVRRLRRAIARLVPVEPIGDSCECTPERECPEHEALRVARESYAVAPRRGSA